MKSPLAKARDKWLLSDEGKRCCLGTATGQYLQNRLELAFLSGANFSDQRIKELEKAIKDVCDVIHNEGRVSKWKIANWLEQALKG